jgi:hypothetical protein
MSLRYACCRGVTGKVSHDKVVRRPVSTQHDCRAQHVDLVFIGILEDGSLASHTVISDNEEALLQLLLILPHHQRGLAPPWPREGAYTVSQKRKLSTPEARRGPPWNADCLSKAAPSDTALSFPHTRAKRPPHPET